MVKAPVIEEGHFWHTIKVAALKGQTPARVAALLCVDLAENLHWLLWERRAH